MQILIMVIRVSVSLVIQVMCLYACHSSSIRRVCVANIFPLGIICCSITNFALTPVTFILAWMKQETLN